jgi:hypothetical protein
MKLFSHRTQLRIVKTGLKFANEDLICNTRELNRLPGRQRSIRQTPANSVHLWTQFLDTFADQRNFYIQFDFELGVG